MGREYLSRMIKNVGKLKRNMEQMTAEQQKQYEKPLRKLKKEIMVDAMDVINDFLLTGCMILADDKAGLDDFAGQANKIIAKDGNMAIDRAFNVLFATYDMDKFMEALIPLHYRIFYEAYGPVWLSHCRKVEDPEYPFRNDIIKMEWDVKNGFWTNRAERAFMTMLPPTAELLEKAYREEKEAMLG
ncbi:MAG: hypothetical protein LUC83_11185 [Clostridiales bacterium]|nr:hypothetical protein [Clostridiales bacterium]